jgi:hypothetical protein
MEKHSARKKIRNSKVKPAAVKTRRPARRRHEPQIAVDEKELARRVLDEDDPVRYMVVSEFNREMIFYYNVSHDGFVLNDPTGGTLFKRRNAAEGVRRLLRPGVTIAKYSVKDGKLKRISPFRASR